MTTTVTVTTHPWPVKVEIIDTYGERTTTTTEIPPNSDTGHRFYLTSTRELHLTELPAPPKAEATT